MSFSHNRLQYYDSNVLVNWSGGIVLFAGWNLSGVSCHACSLDLYNVAQHFRRVVALALCDYFRTGEFLQLTDFSIIFDNFLLFPPS